MRRGASSTAVGVDEDVAHPAVSVPTRSRGSATRTFTRHLLNGRPFSLAGIAAPS